ncbi:MAG TPA: hypothetical protein VMS71_00885, partial [Candidatus Acidoferrum sp.]|nr:hypothetical protein [Candidatus Acidoferrum sp.]
KSAEATKSIQKEEEPSLHREQLQPSDNYKQSTKDKKVLKRPESELRSRTAAAEKQEIAAAKPSPAPAAPQPAPSTGLQSNTAAQIVVDSFSSQRKSGEQNLAMSAETQQAATPKAAPQAVSMADNMAKRDVAREEGAVDQLAALRKTRDSLLALGPSTESSVSSKLNLPGISQGLVKGQEVPRAVRKDDRELKLIQTCYSIATMTKDTTEYNQVVGIIEETAADTSSAYRSVATSYLSRLKNR